MTMCPRALNATCPPAMTAPTHPTAVQQSAKVNCLLSLVAIIQTKLAKILVIKKTVSRQIQFINREIFLK